MVHERDEKYEVQDDGEYHFSDDQTGYDSESPDMAAATAPVVTKVDYKAKVITLVKQNQKPLMGVGIFIVLIFIVYKILAPSSAIPATDFPATEAAKNTSLPARSTTTTTTTMTPAPAPVVTAPVTGNPSVPEPTIAAAPSQIGAPQNMEAPAPAVIVAGVPAPSPTETYVPRSAEVENEMNAMQGKLQDMNLRLASMEGTLTRLGQMIQELKMNKPAAMGQQAPQAARPKPFVPKTAYTVQAIIPGRAWLKSENGDTVTVTQGDILQGYGRVVKIDPYDGNVQIDVGGRTVSLSYGSGN